MVPLTAAERKILAAVCLLEESPKELRVVRKLGKPSVTINVGKRRFESDQIVEAISALYSRGLLKQESLNRFVLTDAGLQAARGA